MVCLNLLFSFLNLGHLIRVTASNRTQLALLSSTNSTLVQEDTCEGRCGRQMRSRCSCDEMCFEDSSCCLDFLSKCEEMKKRSTKLSRTYVFPKFMCTETRIVIISSCISNIKLNDTRGLPSLEATENKETLFERTDNSNFFPVADLATGRTLLNWDIFTCFSHHYSKPIILEAYVTHLLNLSTFSITPLSQAPRSHPQLLPLPYTSSLTPSAYTSSSHFLPHTFSSYIFLTLTPSHLQLIPLPHTYSLTPSAHTSSSHLLPHTFSLYLFLTRPPSHLQLILPHTSSLTPSAHTSSHFLPQTFSSYLFCTLPPSHLQLIPLPHTSSLTPSAHTSSLHFLPHTFSSYLFLTRPPSHLQLILPHTSSLKPSAHTSSSHVLPQTFSSYLFLTLPPSHLQLIPLPHTSSLTPSAHTSSAHFLPHTFSSYLFCTLPPSHLQLIPLPHTSSFTP
ncbi:hypothetical protein Bpfe_000676 [Biomphalaria pfeifferi]|uniref:SMB domain-containing protein n=1 Tax=Biomphalaria pfeifferi TaxID=112525 RepID=A0AAD8FNS7_BIOPF|nr:hypothetical protein Bpfe_000676 [Biomphalaria pfeifferi]